MSLGQHAIRSRSQLGDSAEQLPNALPDIALSYGEVMRLLLRLGYGSGVTRSTFNEYLKSLRKLGIPFGNNAPGVAGRPAEYRYDHIMEMALTQSLRVYHVVPDSILHGIARHRVGLRHFYRRAYNERGRGKGATVRFTDQGGRHLELSGLFLDLDIRFSGGRMVNFGPPKLLEPSEVLMLFATRLDTAQFFLPIPLSKLAERVVAIALTSMP